MRETPWYTGVSIACGVQRHSHRLDNDDRHALSTWKLFLRRPLESFYPKIGNHRYDSSPSTSCRHNRSMCLADSMVTSRCSRRTSTIPADMKSTEPLRPSVLCSQADSPRQINPQIGNRRIVGPNFIRASLGRSSRKGTLNPSTTVPLTIRLSHPQAGSVASTKLP